MVKRTNRAHCGYAAEYSSRARYASLASPIDGAASEIETDENNPNHTCVLKCTIEKEKWAKWRAQLQSSR